MTEVRETGTNERIIKLTHIPTEKKLPKQTCFVCGKEFRPEGKLSVLELFKEIHKFYYSTEGEANLFLCPTCMLYGAEFVVNKIRQDLLTRIEGYLEYEQKALSEAEKRIDEHVSQIQEVTAWELLLEVKQDESKKIFVIENKAEIPF